MLTSRNVPVAGRGGGSAKAVGPVNWLKTEVTINPDTATNNQRGAIVNPTCECIRRIQNQRQYVEKWEQFNGMTM